MIENSTSCADEDVYSSSERVDLAVDIDTTVDSESVELLFVMLQVLENSLDLR